MPTIDLNLAHARREICSRTETITKKWLSMYALRSSMLRGTEGGSWCININIDQVAKARAWVYYVPCLGIINFSLFDGVY